MSVEKIRMKWTATKYDSFLRPAFFVVYQATGYIINKLYC